MTEYSIIVKSKEDGVRIHKIFYAYSLKPEKLSNSDLYDQPEDFRKMFWVNSEQFASLYRTLSVFFERISRPKIAPQNFWARRVLGFFNKRTPVQLIDKSSAVNKNLHDQEPANHPML